ncbi:MAG TPA: DUF2631 domain-containing protein [Pseudonocardia sp.]|nr:DUF2631 domain-containing protein [Pseudonocardia sp.]
MVVHGDQIIKASEQTMDQSSTEEPSVRWGWHGGFPRGSLIAGWSVAAILVTILLNHALGGHHEGHVADVYLAIISVVLILLLGRRTAHSRHSWRR